MNVHTLLEPAIAAVGGLEKWQRIRELKATMSSGGLAFSARLRGAKRQLTVSVSPNEPRAEFTKTVEFSNNARTRGSLRQHEVRWDDLDLLYFKGYAHGAA